MFCNCKKHLILLYQMSWWLSFIHSVLQWQSFTWLTFIIEPCIDETILLKHSKCELGKPSNQRENITPTMKKSIEVFNTSAIVQLGVWLPKHGDASKEEGSSDIQLTFGHMFGNRRRKCENEVIVWLPISRMFGYRQKFENQSRSSEAHNKLVKFEKSIW